MPPPDPIPSPWKTLRTTSLHLLCALILLVLAWSLWYAYAAHRLNAKLAEYRARGEPADAKDFIPHRLDPKDNAYEIALAADRSLTLTRDEDDLVKTTSRPTRPSLPLSPADMNTARAMLEHHAPTLLLIDQFRAAPGVAWPMDPLPFQPRSPSTLPMHRLASFRYTAALFYHQDHQDKAAIQAVGDIRALARTCDAYPTMTGHLSALSCEADASRALRQISQDLELQSPSNPRGITRQDIFQTIHDLFDRHASDEFFRAAIRGQRIWWMVACREFPQRRPWLRPLYLLSLRRALDSFDQALRALQPDVATFPATKALLPRLKVILPDLSGWGFKRGSNLEALVHCLEVDDFDDLADLHYRALTDRNAAALCLALRLYELDHAQMCPSLDALVGAYMPPPTDPFRADGGRLTYVPSRHLFYSVNRNGIDDGAPPTTGFYWLGLDAIYPLGPATPPAPQTATTTTRSTSQAPRTPSGN